MGVINGLRAILDQSDYYYRETKLSGNGIVTIVGFSNSCELCQQIYIQKYILFFITKNEDYVGCPIFGNIILGVNKQLNAACALRDRLHIRGVLHVTAAHNTTSLLYIVFSTS